MRLLVSGPISVSLGLSLSVTLPVAPRTHGPHRWVSAETVVLSTTRATKRSKHVCCEAYERVEIGMAGDRLVGDWSW